MGEFLYQFLITLGNKGCSIRAKVSYAVRAELRPEGICTPFFPEVQKNYPIKA